MIPDKGDQQKNPNSYKFGAQTTYLICSKICIDSIFSEDTMLFNNILCITYNNACHKNVSEVRLNQLKHTKKIL